MALDFPDRKLVPHRQEHVEGTQVFTWHLDDLEVSSSEAYRLISTSEVSKILRTPSDLLGRRRLLSRVLLRATLGAWTGAAAWELEFSQGPYGKPHLPGGPAFNSSHSGPHFVMAIRSSGDVGVDIEVVRPSPDLMTIARCYFTADEADEIGADPASSTDSFFRAWVRKEALLKGVGAGLSISLQAFRVSSQVAPVGTNVLLDSNLSAQYGSAWRVVPITAPQGTQAALAWNREGVGDGKELSRDSVV